jgi:hypothetical protein
VRLTFRPKNVKKTCIYGDGAGHARTRVPWAWSIKFSERGTNWSVPKVKDVEFVGRRASTYIVVPTYIKAACSKREQGQDEEKLIEDHRITTNRDR